MLQRQRANRWPIVIAITFILPTPFIFLLGGSLGSSPFTTGGAQA